jgi:hypothetical protein
MLFIFGIKFARICRYSDRDHICYPCSAFDREVRVFRPYFHFCLIPVFPTGPKQWEMRCKNCGDETVLESVVREYEGRARTPFYLYSAIILFAAVSLYWVYWNKNAQSKKRDLVSRPAAGDVYTIEEKGNNETDYSFLKIVSVAGDSLGVLHNHLDYGEFVGHLTADDYFEKNDTMRMVKKDLSKMLDRGEIYSVDRGYGEGSSFNSIK